MRIDIQTHGFDLTESCIREQAAHRGGLIKSVFEQQPAAWAQRL